MHMDHYKHMKTLGETKESDVIDLTEMAEIEAPLYETDLANLTGQLFGLQELPKIDKQKRINELKDITRSRDASGDSGSTGAGLSHYDYQRKFMNDPGETKEEENPYQALAK